MTEAICSSGAHIRDRSTEELDEKQYSHIIETLSVVSLKSIDNQLMGEEEGRKIADLILLLID
jgi:hypothetical protein